MSDSTPAPDRLSLALDWVRDEAESAVSGSGGHDVTYKTACFLVHGFELQDGDMLLAMAAYNQAKCSPPWTENQLKHKIENAKRSANKYTPGWLYRKLAREKGLMPERQNSGLSSGVAVEPTYQPKWKLPFDYNALQRANRNDWHITVDWFREQSPVDVSKVRPMNFLEMVYQPGDKILICTKYNSKGDFIHWVGKGSYRLAARPGVKASPSKLPFGGHEGVWFLAQPVDGEWKPNTDGNLSRRSQANIPQQRFVVLECDHKECDCPCADCKGADNPNIGQMWMNFLAQVPMAVVAIYTSGGKSLHALCKMDFPSKAHLDRWKQNHGGMFSKLGADPRAWSPTQLTRLPGCMRGQRKQELIYLNPNPSNLGTPIGLGGNICE